MPTAYAAKPGIRNDHASCFVVQVLGESQRVGGSRALLRVAGIEAALQSLLLLGLHKLERCHHASVPVDQSRQACTFWIVGENGDLRLPSRYLWLPSSQPWSRRRPG
jgi:hypothetical protein